MTVVFFCRFFYPHIGGVERHVYELSKRLQKKGWKVIVITEQHDSSLKLKETYDQISIYRIPVAETSKGKKYRIWKWLFVHRSLIKSAKVIHCHDVFYWFLPFRFMYPLKHVYTTFHGYEGDSLPTRKAIVIHKIAEILSREVICVGEYLKKWYGTKTKFITYGAVSLPERKEELYPKRIREIVFIGRLDPEAGIMRYLELLNMLKQDGVLPHLSVLGEGRLAEVARTFVRKHRLNVTFYGAVRDISPFLSRADCAFTSRYLSTLESFAYQKYVFCLYNNDIHRDCFLLSPFHSWISLTGDISQMVKEITLLIQHPHIKDDEIAHAYSWVRQQTWDKVTKLYLSLWKI
ncbi:MAG: glycosyltransferase family 4 protein [Candidatus Levybacteria bacterium]|nr:glycosyltransferase family 4 protein [Candidatus Levybacteria bacterium]